MTPSYFPKTRMQRSPLEALMQPLAAAVLLSACAGVIGCKRAANNVPGEVTEAIENVKQAYCPDRRLCVFDVKVTARGKNVYISGESDNNEAITALRVTAKKATNDYKVEVDLHQLPDAGVRGRTFGRVKQSVASLRANPSDGAELVNQLLLGTTVRVLKRQEDWYYVQGEDGYLGWLWGDFLQFGDENDRQKWSAQERVVFKEPLGQLYTSATESSTVLAEVVGGGLLEKVAEKKGWLELKLPDGRTGFVRAGSVISHEEWSRPPPDPAAGVLRTALAFHGKPYLWGGNSPKGFDCSGLTQTVFRWNGHQLLRDASQQYRQGQPVEPGPDYENLVAGDLVFFASSSGRPNHVGIYLGNGKFLHSSGRETTGVTINSLLPSAPDYSEYRASHFLGARRILTE